MWRFKAFAPSGMLELWNQSMMTVIQRKHTFFIHRQKRYRVRTVNGAFVCIAVRDEIKHNWKALTPRKNKKIWINYNEYIRGEAFNDFKSL